MIYEMRPVAHVRTDLPGKFALPRQGGRVEELTGRVVFEEGFRDRNALRGIEGFSHLWLIWVFDRVESGKWSPTVRPPRLGGNTRIGVFASRSPYRPNPIGLSCVKLEKIDGLKLAVSGHDFLDGTPVLDLKPYIPAADAFPEAKAGWRDEADAAELPVDFSENALRKMMYVEKLCGLDLKNFCAVQLSHAPTSPERKRIKALADGCYGIGCRTWQVIYQVNDNGVQVTDVRSHYVADELKAGADDPYGDKDFHRAFRREFGDGD